MTVSPLWKQQAGKPHTEMEQCIQICKSLRHLFDGSAGRGTQHIPEIMCMLLLQLTELICKKKKKDGLKCDTHTKPTEIICSSTGKFANSLTY